MQGEELPPLVVVGMEGFWGTLIMLVVIYPIGGWVGLTTCAIRLLQKPPTYDPMTL